MIKQGEKIEIRGTFQQKVDNDWVEISDITPYTIKLRITNIVTNTIYNLSTTDNTIKTVTVALDLYKHTNGRYYTLPSNVGFITEEYVKITPVGGAAITKPVLVKPITYDYYVKNYENRYKKPSIELIWRLDYNYDSAQTGYIVELITDGSTIDSYHISYLKYPQNMVIGTTNCEIIDETFHDEIVSESVKMITAALNDEGYSVAVNEANSDK